MPLTRSHPKRNCHQALSYGAENDAAGSKFYILRSLVPRNWKKRFVVEQTQNPSRHLLVILLMLIKCQGDKLSEGVYPMQPHTILSSL